MTDFPPDTAAHNDLLTPSSFLQIPGPNPILETGTTGEWDGNYIETAGIFEDLGTYYLYYHGSGTGLGYQLGVATASHPLGPFKRHDANPILQLGEPGTWEDLHVAHALLIKQGTNRYYMWYCGKSQQSLKDQEAKINTWEQDVSVWSIGLATAPHPLGPWTKCENNPILPDFGYVSSVVQAKGKYFLYTAYPIGSIGPDYSPIALATADNPEGPWTRYEHNPIVNKGEWGEWDDGGYSDAFVVYSSGVFHMFMAGCKLHPTRIESRESIGYAWSTDGIHFQKYGRNPIATRDADPNTAAMGEPRVLFELPLIYIYHTQRYKEPILEKHKKKFPLVEDTGVQVLVTQRPFCFDMPLMQMDQLEGGQVTSLDDCPAISLGVVNEASLTVRCRFDDTSAKNGLSLDVRTSADGIVYDTVNRETYNMPAAAGESAQATFSLPTGVRYAKVSVANTAAGTVSQLNLTATLHG